MVQSSKTRANGQYFEQVTKLNILKEKSLSTPCKCTDSRCMSKLKNIRSEYRTSFFFVQLLFIISLKFSLCYLIIYTYKHFLGYTNFNSPELFYEDTFF